MEEGNVTYNLNYVSLDVKGGRKIDFETSPTAFCCYKWYQYRGVFLNLRGKLKQNYLASLNS